MLYLSKADDKTIDQCFHTIQYIYFYLLNISFYISIYSLNLPKYVPQPSF